MITGLWISCLIALWKAMKEHQEFLSVLYQELDPERFLDAYVPMLERAKKGSAFEAAMRGHIGNARMLMGKYTDALPWFESENRSPDVLLMQAENRALCLFYLKDAGLAAAVEDWKQKMQAVKKTRKAVSELSMEMLQIRRQVENGCADGAMQGRVQSCAQSSNKKSYRISMRLLLARIYLILGYRKTAKDELSELARVHGKVIEIRQASELLSKLEKEG